jgi:glutaredoxin 3
MKAPVQIQCTIAFLGSVLNAFVQHICTDERGVYMTEKQSSDDNVMVVVYSTQHCPFCVMVKDYLSKNKIAFVDYDVGHDRAKAIEMVQKSGQTGVPVLDIGGRIIVGFNQHAIDLAIQAMRVPESKTNLFGSPLDR